MILVMLISQAVIELKKKSLNIVFIFNFDSYFMTIVLCKNYEHSFCVLITSKAIFIYSIESHKLKVKTRWNASTDISSVACKEISCFIRN